jgi:RND superfamily putative drug exporter
MGGLSIVGTFLVLRGLGEAMSVSVFALNLVTGLGLGLAIDYSLFIISRYREELAAGHVVREALRRTLATAGRTVLFSSLTVAAAMAALLIFPQRFLYSMGLGGTAVALIAAAVALVALPAVLALLGERVNALSPRRLRRTAQAEAGREHRGAWYRLSRFVMRRPGRIAAISAVVLIAFGTPALGISFTTVDATVLPKDSEARQVDDALKSRFPAANSTSPLRLVVESPPGDGVERFAGDLDELPGAARVSEPRPAGPGVTLIEVVPRSTPLTDEAQSLVREVRSLSPPFDLRVTGQTAHWVDQKESVGAHVPWAFAIIAGSTLVILFVMTGSVVLPFKALVMNVLTLSAAFGILVLVFQDGRLEGLLDYTSQGALDLSQPIVLFALAFGLSTDYGVFLLSRIKEARDRGAPDSEAVAIGLERTGRIVTAAALLFSVAVGAFATSQIVFIKELGIGTALAVLIDASIVRALLVPSLMEMLGKWNWWAPPPLRRLHRRFGLSEGEPAPAAARG